jgi:hypothetical protein
MIRKLGPDVEGEFTPGKYVIDEVAVPGTEFQNRIPRSDEF